MLTDSVSSRLYGTVGGIDTIVAFERNAVTAFDKFLVKNYFWVYYPVPPAGANPNPNSEMAFNMDLAEKYYLQAMNLYSNRELKAKAAFMAAKTEQDRFFNTHRDGKGEPPRTYFKLLKDSYSDTLYYQEILEECGTFRAFVAN